MTNVCRHLRVQFESLPAETRAVMVCIVCHQPGASQQLVLADGVRTHVAVHAGSCARLLHSAPCMNCFVSSRRDDALHRAEAAEDIQAQAALARGAIEYRAIADEWLDARWGDNATDADRDSLARLLASAARQRRGQAAR